MKRKSLLLLLSIFIPLALMAQIESFVYEGATNSFKKHYENLGSKLIYSYCDSTQTHDYSGNWDFDGDGKKDSIFFLGNGGAHLYYHIRIILSSDHLIRDFEWLIFDSPYLETYNNFKKLKYNDRIQFVVYDFDHNGVEDIYLNFDNKFSKIPKEFRRQGLTSKRMILYYKNKKIKFTNFKI